jgi:Tfp pilus assembly protein PilX
MALVLALGVSVILGISGTTAAVYSTHHQTSSARSKADRSAHSLAEAGLAYAYSRLFASGTPTMPNAVPETTVPLNNGTVRYYGVLNGETWTLVGVGSVRNPGGAGDVVRTARGKAVVGSAQQGTANNAVWNYV